MLKEELQLLIRRPRHLRAIPSLVVLTTAMAWASLPDCDDTTAFELLNRSGAPVSQQISLEPGDEPIIG